MESLPPSRLTPKIKHLIMKTWKVQLTTLAAVSVILLLGFTYRKIEKPVKKHAPFVPKGCVFRTVFGEESSDSSFRFKTPQRVEASLDRGLEWIIRAQNQNGGWGAGSHARQELMDPHAVPADPATTSMVAMALLRNGTTLTKGEYSSSLRKALDYLLTAVETSGNSNTITTDRYTDPDKARPEH